MEELIKFLNELKSEKERRIDERGRIVIPIEYRSKKVEEVVYIILEDCLVISYDNIQNGTRKEVDELGRIEIEKVLREKLGWEEKDLIEIMNFKSYIILRKKEDNSCVFCRSKDKLTKYKRKLICQKCKNRLMEGRINV